MADTSIVTDEEQTEFMGRMSQAGLAPHLVRRVNKSPGLAAVMVKALKGRLALVTRVCGTSPEQRKAILDRWKQERSFGYGQDDEVGGPCIAR